MNEPRAEQTADSGPVAALAAGWGLGGVLLILGYAVIRLSPMAVETFHRPLGWYHWALLALTVLFMAYSEGYRGFQRSFSPRVAERAARLRAEVSLVRGVLAPFYCAGYFAAPRRTRVTAYSVTATVILLVQLVRHLDQPWRGIVDAGVVVGLVWGVAATLALGVRHLYLRNL